MRISRETLAHIITLAIGCVPAYAWHLATGESAWEAWVTILIVLLVGDAVRPRRW
jgi:hypothetical protein